MASAEDTLAMGKITGTPLIAGWVAEVVLFAVVVFVFEVPEPVWLLAFTI